MFHLHEWIRGTFPVSSGRKEQRETDQGCGAESWQAFHQRSVLVEIAPIENRQQLCVKRPQ